MSYYQVSTTYKLCGNKPLLESISLNTSYVYYPYLVGLPTSYLSHSRYFHTLPQAQHYISYLYSRYPKTNGFARTRAPPPILDALQLTFF